MRESHDTPHLVTTLMGPLKAIEKQILSHQNDIENWFKAQWQKTPAPFYGSVDLRNAGFKVAPVDMNLFPAGFNNLKLNPAFIKLGANATLQTIKKFSQDAKKILLIPENHTRNQFYWQNIAALMEILTLANYEVRLGSIDPSLTEKFIITQAEKDLIIYPIHKKNQKLQVEDFEAEVIILNNDLSDGLPDILQDIKQIITPPAELGWSQRLKTQHFTHYAAVAKSFADLIKMDPWLIDPLFKKSADMNFMAGDGQADLAEQVDTLLHEIKQKYLEYDIQQDPYVVIKANAGTYGMAVMMVKSAAQLTTLNRKQRTHMSKSKGGQSVSSVIIQEGVHTFEKWGQDNNVAEPVVYMIGERVIGGFYRIHKDKAFDENLNAPGMHFEPLAFAKPCDQPQASNDECQNRFYAYGVIARLSMLAAAREIASGVNA